MERITTPDQFAHLKTMSIAERKQWLEGHADNIFDNEQYTRQLTDAEYKDLQVGYAETGKLVLDAEKEKKDFISSWKHTNTELFGDFKRISKEIRTGMREVQEDIYEIVNAEDRMVYRFNQNGEVVSERKARLADLEQGTIYQSLREQNS